MLEKTFELLKEATQGAPRSPDGKCYDDAELEAFVRQALDPLMHGPPEIRKRLQQLGATIVPNNFYSEIPDLESIDKSFAEGWDESFDYIFEHDKLAEFLEQKLFPFSHELDPPLEPTRPGEFAWKNPAFSYSDAMAYYCFIRYAKPRTIVEVGCGWSTLIADLAIRRNGGGQLICIDPSPKEFVHSIASVKSIEMVEAQRLGLGFFNDLLQNGDIFFIDSTHTVKHNSDCLHIYLKILPNITSSIFVQVHDIMLPRSFPAHWLRRHIYWTEQYLVMAYLVDNFRSSVLYGSRYHYDRNIAQLTGFMHRRFAPGGGSLWFSQNGASDASGSERKLA